MIFSKDVGLQGKLNLQAVIKSAAKAQPPNGLGSAWGTAQRGRGIPQTFGKAALAADLITAWNFSFFQYSLVPDGTNTRIDFNSLRLDCVVSSCPGRPPTTRSIG